MARRERLDPSEMELTEKVVFINRVAKVMKGGRRFHFTAVVVVGDMGGHVGAAMAKATEVPEAIRKAGAVARKYLLTVPLRGSTVPNPVLVRFGAAKVLIKPAPPGTGLIAGGGVRAVLEMAGVKDAVAKSLGSGNPANVVKATVMALSQLRSPDQVLARRRAVSPEASLGG
ncbi:MAG TPA: 30S ribosomal protein S5 [Dehalococcoidia bacterium]|nr:30S ribosomal protein S5 [Dehalococcoidia bacterium]